MSQRYACLNYGSCPGAGVGQVSIAGVAPVCSGCGGLMSPQGSAKQNSGIGKVAKWAGLALVGVVALTLVWKLTSWGYHRTVGYDLTGKWRAERTTVLGFSLPIGANLEFTPDSALVLDTRVPVAEYERDGNVVHVIVAGGGGIQANFTFRFEDADHIIFDGPIGVTLRYRRVKGMK